MEGTTPVMFKKKSARGSQRARPVDSDTTNQPTEETAAGSDESPSALAAKLKNKHKSRVKPKSQLSFGAEEEGEGEVFKLKKSNLSKKLTLKTVAPSDSLPAATSGSQTYSKEYLSELKASTPSSRPRLHEETSYDADVSMTADSLAQSSLSQGVILTDDVDMDSSIPSSSAIQAAKEKRDRLRKTGGADEDFISLSVTRRADQDQGPHPTSRLVREDDELGEGDDEFAQYTSAQERIALGRKSRKVEAEKRRNEMSELILDAAEEDEETIEWEQEQLRRGGLRAADPTAKAAKPVYKPAPIPDSIPIPDLDLVVTRLSGSLTNLTTSHQKNATAMASLAKEREEIEARDREMREMIAKAEDKRSWFAAFREWVESMATFLDEKFPQLEKLEDEHISLLQERYDMISKRRRVDDEDDLSLFLGMVSAPVQPLMEEMDELGRTVQRANPTTARQNRITARSGRRSRRRAQDQQRLEEEGYSTDDTLPPSDGADFEIAIEKLLAKGKDILSDVRAKDFKDPNKGLGKWFSEWRERFGESYTGAWGGLGMVGGWEFWTRLEILGWNPLEDNRSLDTFSWYKSLYDYSRPPQPDQDEDEEPELGPDGDLVSAMVSTAVIPRLCKLVEGGALDPYSSKDLRTVVDLAEQIEMSVDRDNLKFQMFMKSVFMVFQRAFGLAQETAAPYIALNNPQFHPDSIPARRRYLARSQKLLNNTMRWRKYSGERYGIGQLVTSLLADCMLPIAEGGWEVGGEDSIRRAVTALPEELVPAVVKTRLRSR